MKDLSSQLRARIELWQINSREETRTLGGLAICGREYCCRSIKHDVGSISMKMLKEQSLLPNSSKLSGACGRLFCCSAYEHQQYVDEKKTLPKLGSLVMIHGQKWHIKEINVLAHKLILHGEQGNRIMISADELVFNSEKNFWYDVLAHTENKEQ